MNNSQFRQLLLDTPQSSKTLNSVDRLPGRDEVVASSLGSRLRSSIPMTPRSVVNSTGVDFARQLAERNASINPTVTKKFRSAPAPKGTKLGPGYQDRTKFRTSVEDDERGRRVKALEEMVKLGQMEMATFEVLRDKIVGGDIKNVHLVKGLDLKLLERVKRGEDVLAGSPASMNEDSMSQANGEDQIAKTDAEIDDELEKIEGKQIQPVAKDKKSKKGEMAPPMIIAGKKRSRDEILKELKASRVTSAKQPSLGPRFTKVGDKKEKRRIEKDDKGRDVLITIDEEGKVKRKIRRKEPDSTSDRGLLMPDKHVKPLGIEVLAVAQSTPDVDNEDIFEGVGAEYNPLGDLGEEDSGDSDTSISSRKERLKEPLLNQSQIEHDTNLESKSVSAQDSSATTSHPMPLQPDKHLRNYFNDSDPPSAATHTITPTTLDNSALLAALKKASAIPLPGATSEPEVAKLERRRKMLESHDRDADDMDIGFGGSRFEDGEDGDASKVKLSIWGQEGAEEEQNRKGKRKRGGKKRKGDGENAVDVLRLIEKRKAEGGNR